MSAMFDSRNSKKVAPASGWLTIADEGERLRKYTRLIFALAWFIPALVATLQIVLWGGLSREVGLATTLLWQIVVWGVWAIWSQVILTIVERVHLTADNLWQWIAIHVANCLSVCIVNVLLIASLNRYFTQSASTDSPQLLSFSPNNNLAFQLVLYWAVVGAAYMVEYLRRYRERDKLALHLEQKLSHMQLDALRMQLNPHFLFNALNSVAALMDINVDKAQSMLTRISDLLRLSLKSAGSPTIPVWQEIELAELYLSVAKFRYGDGLEVDINVDPHVVDAQIPSFILQPLIENALKHGLQPGREGQQISIGLKQSGDALELLVEDNGRGLDGLITNSGRFLAARPSVDGLGIGLTNTRSRLTMLYGDRYAFRMTNTANGGCRVEIRLPVE